MAFQIKKKPLNESKSNLVFILVPINAVALNHPLSEVVSFKSHSADGKRNEIQRSSMASLAFAHPHTNSNQ